MKKQFIPTLAGSILVLTLCWYMDRIARNEIANVVRYIVYAMALTVVIVLLGLIIFAALLVRERLLKERANRQAMEREAKVMYLVADEGTYLTHQTTMLLLRVRDDGEQPMYADRQFLNRKVEVAGRHLANQVYCEALICGCEEFMILESIRPQAP